MTRQHHWQFAIISVMNTISLLDLMTTAYNYPLLEEALAEVRYSDSNYFSLSLSRTENLEVVLICFSGLQSTKVHTHGESNCVTRCLKGLVNDVSYSLEDDQLCPCTSTLIKEGEINSTPIGLYHQVANMLPNDTSILINFYSPPLPLQEDVYETVSAWGEQDSEID